MAEAGRAGFVQIPHEKTSGFLQLGADPCDFVRGDDGAKERAVFDGLEPHGARQGYARQAVAPVGGVAITRTPGVVPPFLELEGVLELPGSSPAVHHVGIGSHSSGDQHGRAHAARVVGEAGVPRQRAHLLRAPALGRGIRQQEAQPVAQLAAADIAVVTQRDDEPGRALHHIQKCSGFDVIRGDALNRCEEAVVVVLHPRRGNSECLAEPVGGCEAARRTVIVAQSSASVACHELGLQQQCAQKRNSQLAASLIGVREGCEKLSYAGHPPVHPAG